MGGWGPKGFFEACHIFLKKKHWFFVFMIESVFFLFLVLSLGLIVYSVAKRDSAFLILGSVLLFGAGLMLLDSGPVSGLEEDNGYLVNYLGDNNFSIDVNTGYRNAGNDSSLNVLGTLFTYGGLVGILLGLGLLVKYRGHGGVAG